MYKHTRTYVRIQEYPTHSPLVRPLEAKATVVKAEPGSKPAKGKATTAPSRPSRPDPPQDQDDSGSDGDGVQGSTKRRRKGVKTVQCLKCGKTNGDRKGKTG